MTAFTKVDFPTFGLPTKEIRKFLLSKLISSPSKISKIFEVNFVIPKFDIAEIRKAVSYKHLKLPTKREE